MGLFIKMTKGNQLQKIRYSIEELWQTIKYNSFRISDFSKIEYTNNPNTFIKNIRFVSIDTTPQYYDLYNFLGTTSSTNQPSPASAYNYRYSINTASYAYYFIYPRRGFPVPSGESPEDYTDGATPWEFKTTISIVKTVYQFPKMPDWALDGAKLVAYLQRTDNQPVGNITYYLRAAGTNLNEITVDFNYFYRWVKLNEGYNFEFYAIYPFVDSDIFINAKLYFYNPKKVYHG